MQARAKLRNPYVAGKAINRAEGFFGREDILGLVETELSHAHSNAIVLYGQRRIGKTSILKQLERRLTGPEFCSVYFDLQDKAETPMGRVLAEIADALAARANLDGVRASDFDDRGEYFRTSFLPRIYEALGDRRPLLLFDEFDVLDLAAEKELPESAAANRFFPVVRTIMESEERLAFVFVIGRKVQDLSLKAMAVFKAARGERVSVLQRADAEALIRVAEREGTMRFSDAALSRILALTACHPMFTQLLCQMAWDVKHPIAGNGKPAANPPVVGPADVDLLVPKALDAGENYFEWIWNGLPPAERLIMATIAGIGEKVVTRDELAEVLQNLGVRILTRELDLAPEQLVDWEMLRRVDGGYVFFIELLRQWIATRKPVEKAKDELYRINPHAESLYQSGYSYYRNNDFENSIDLLRRAISVNPNHLKARLLLARVYADFNHTAEAIAELEQAFRYDEDAVRPELARTLLVAAERLEQSDTNQALATYERVLEITPNNRVALNQRAAILIRQGDAAVAAGNLDAALAAYESAGATERAAAVRQAKHRLFLEESAKQARVYEANEQWDEALKIYERLVEEDPGTEEWRTSLERVQAAERLAREYALGEDGLRRSLWEPAMRAFANVVYIQPDYREAAARLAEAVSGTRSASRSVPALAAAAAAAAEPASPAPQARPAKRGAEGKPPREALREVPLEKLREVLPPGPEVMIAKDRAAVPTFDEPERKIALKVAPVALALNRDGRLVACAGKDAIVRVFDTSTGETKATIKVDGAVTALGYNPETSALSIVNKYGLIMVWTDETKAWAVSGVLQPTCLGFSPEGSLFALGSAAGDVRVSKATGWNIASVKQPERINAVAIGQDQSLATASSDRVARVWSVRSPAVIRSFAHPADVTQIAVHPVAPIVVTGSDDALVRIWREDISLAEIRHHAPLSLATFDQKGAVLVTASVDGLAHLWDCSELPEAQKERDLPEMARVQSPRSTVAVAFSWRSRKLATATDKELSIWNLAI